MKRKHSLTLKELFGRLVDAAVGDVMADRGSEPPLAAPMSAQATVAPLPQSTQSEADQSASFQIYFSAVQKSKFTTLLNEFHFGKMGSPSDPGIASMQIIRVVISLLLVVAAFLLPFLAWT